MGKNHRGIAMYLPRCIIEELKSERVLKLREEYERVLGVDVSPGFSFIAFDSVKHYIETLEECIRTKKPFVPQDYDLGEERE